MRSSVNKQIKSGAFVKFILSCSLFIILFILKSNLREKVIKSAYTGHATYGTGGGYSVGDSHIKINIVLFLLV